MSRETTGILLNLLRGDNLQLGNNWHRLDPNHNVLESFERANEDVEIEQVDAFSVFVLRAQDSPVGINRCTLE